MFLKIATKARSSNVGSSAFTVVAGDITEALGVITWDADFPTALTFGVYDYELDYKDSEGLKRLAEGIITVR